MSRSPLTALRRFAGWLFPLVFLLGMTGMSLFIALACGRTLTGISPLWAVLPAAAAVLLLVLLRRQALARPVLPRSEQPGSTVRSRRFLLGLMLASLAVRCIVALAVDTQPDSDFAMLYQAAQQLAQGNNVLPQTPYFQYWPYQSAFVAILALFIRLFGAGVTFFRLANALCSALTNGLIYLLARRFSSERAARAAGIVMLLYPGSLLLIPVLTNQHLSELLLVAALLAATARTASPARRAGQSAAAGLLLSLSNAVRPMGAVVLLAAAALFLLRLPQAESRRQLVWELAIPFAALTAAYLAANGLLDALVRLSGLNPLGLTNQVPQWKLILGLNESTVGQYSAEDAALVFGSDPSAADALLAQRLSISPLRLLKLMVRKALYMWGSLEDYSWAFTPSVMAGLDALGLKETVTTILDLLCRLACVSYAALGLLAAAGALRPLVHRERRKLLSPAYSLTALTALAYFCAHLLIEIQLRYRSTMTLLLIAAAAPGLDALTAFLRSRRCGDSPPPPADRQ